MIFCSAWSTFRFLLTISKDNGFRYNPAHLELQLGHLHFLCFLCRYSKLNRTKEINSYELGNKVFINSKLKLNAPEQRWTHTCTHLHTYLIEKHIIHKDCVVINVYNRYSCFFTGTCWWVDYLWWLFDCSDHRKLVLRWCQSLFTGWSASSTLERVVVRKVLGHSGVME